MKKLLFILFFFICYNSFSQSPGNDTSRYIHSPKQYGIWHNRMKADSVSDIPSDTLFSKDGIARIGTRLFVGNGFYWTGTGVTLGPDDDSVTIHWPLICVWEEGFPRDCANLALKDTVVAKYPLNVILKETSGAQFDTLRIKGSATANQYLKSVDSNTVIWATITAGIGSGAIDTVYVTPDSLYMVLSYVGPPAHLDSVQWIGDGGGTGTGVQSVTGDMVDNTDPVNPIINAPPIVTEAIPTWSVLDSLSIPPVSPSTGDIYEVSTVPTGAWVGHAKEITTWDGAAWTFEVPDMGDLLFRVSNDIVSKYTTVWVRVGKIPITQGGQSLGAAMIVGTIDAQSFNINTNNVNRVQIANTGTVRLTNLAGTGTAITGVNAIGVLSRVATVPIGNIDTTVATGLSQKYIRITDGVQYNFTSLANGDLLRYNSGTSQWNNFVPTYLLPADTIHLHSLAAGGGASGWGLTGNTGLAFPDTTRFVGTTNATQLLIKTNGITRIKIDSSGLSSFNKSIQMNSNSIALKQLSDSVHRIYYDAASNSDIWRIPNSTYLKIIDESNNVGLTISGGGNVVASGNVTVAGNISTSGGASVISGGALQIGGGGYFKAGFPGVSGDGRINGLTTGQTAWRMTSSPTALMHIGMGAITAGYAPLKFEGGFATTAATGTGATATITFSNPYGLTVPGAGVTVNISGVTPTAYNGSYVLTASTPTTVSYASAETGSQTVAGRVGVLLTTPEDGAVEFDGTDWYGTSGGVRYKLTRTQTGTAAPATTPATVGIMFVDSTNDKIYISTGTASSADWTILN